MLDLSKVYLSFALQSLPINLMFHSNHVHFGDLLFAVMIVTCVPMLLQVVVLPPMVHKKNEMYNVGSYTSDLAELVSGLNKVFIEILKTDQTFDMSGLDAGDVQSVEKLTIKIGPKLFGDRVQFIQEQEHLADVVKAAKISDDTK